MCMKQLTQSCKSIALLQSNCGDRSVWERTRSRVRRFVFKTRGEQKGLGEACACARAVDRVYSWGLGMVLFFSEASCEKLMCERLRLCQSLFHP
jgi:hypothetical protein